LFLYKYYDALNIGPAKEAFDAGKVLSDIIAMVNRAFWLVAFSLLVMRTAITMGDAAAWYEKAAMWICIVIFGMVVPTVLAIQVLAITFRALDELKNPVATNIWKGVAALVMASLIGCVTVSWIAYENSVHRQETQNAIMREFIMGKASGPLKQ